VATTAKVSAVATNAVLMMDMFFTQTVPFGLLAGPYRRTWIMFPPIAKSGGQAKSLAQWRSYFREKYKPDAAAQNAIAEKEKAQFEAAAKALQDEQDKSIAEDNARITKEFNEFVSRTKTP
jgi:hypothetical protein